MCMRCFTDPCVNSSAEMRNKMAEDKSRTIKAKSLAKAFLATKPEEEKAPVVQVKERKPAVKSTPKPMVKASEIAAVARQRGQVEKAEEKVTEQKVDAVASEIKKEKATEVLTAPVVIRTKQLSEGGVVKKLPACKMAVPRKLPSEEMLIIAAKRKAAAKRIPVPMEVVKAAPVKEAVKEAPAVEVKEEVKVAPVAAEPKKAAPVAKKETMKKEAPKKEAPKKEVKVEAKAAKTAPKKEVKAAPAPKKETAKKTAEKKVADKKAPEKKTAEVVKNTYIQFQSVQYHEETILKMAEQVWTKDLKNKLADLKSMELYVKPEEKMVYYVFNKKVTGGFSL